MSLASHAMIRLRRLWKKTFLLNKLLDSSRYSYPSSQRARCSVALLEQLEPRVMLSGTTYTVNTLSDVVADDGVLSLREAILAANTNTALNEAQAGSSTETDSIVFDKAALEAHALEINSAWTSADGLKIVLGGAELEITDSLQIQGLGADYFAIDANSLSRVFNISGSEIDVSISGLTITGGNTSDWGGGIHNKGTLTLTDASIINNTAGMNGGGIDDIGTTTLVNVFIAGNSAKEGGGINTGSLVMMNSIIVGNSADYGGGIYCGGVFGGESLAIINSTISGNSASCGGGIVTGGELSVDNSIVALNDGGDVAGNIMAAPGFLSSNGSLLGIDPGFVRNPSSGVDGVWGTADDDYGDLQLTECSAAVNAGVNSRAIDSHGIVLVDDIEGKPRIADGIVDAGAYEYQGSPAAGMESPSLVVTTVSDVTDFYDGEITLREAIYYASQTGGPSVITFDKFLTAFSSEVEIVLSGYELPLYTDITIDASGLDAGITINADGKSRVFYSAGATVELIGLTITGGWTGGGGGGVYNSVGTTKITDCTVIGNVDTSDGGGGIYNEVGVLILSNSVVSGNSSNTDGGGINCESGTMLLYDSEIFGNSAVNGGGIYISGTSLLTEISIINTAITGNAAYDGGGIYLYYTSDFPITITNATIAGNFAENGGGGIYNTDSDLTLNNTVIAQNQANSAASDVYASYTAVSSFLGALDGDPGFVTNPSAGTDDAWGTDDDVAGDYHLATGSPLINMGSNTLAVDEQGNPLTKDLDGVQRISDSIIDIGAYEYTVVTFNDANLESAVRDALGKPTGDITAADMATLTSLDASTMNISDLTGLEYATNLTQLFLYDNNISDISLLSDLANLTSLIIFENQIADISPLASLNQLCVLDLDDNLITDISSIAGLTDLEVLGLESNQISDISPLAALTTLHTLYLWNNNISDLTPLAGLTNLTYLDIDNNQVTSLISLAGLTGLTHFEFDNNLVTDISALTGMTSLNSLSLQRNMVTDITPLVNNTGLGSLDYVYLTGNPLESSQQENIDALRNRGTVVYYYENPLTGLDLDFRIVSEIERQSVNVVNEYDFKFDIGGGDADFIQSVRFQTPTGEWYDFEYEDGDGWRYGDDEILSESEFDATYPQGYYTVEITLANGITGSTTVYFGDGDTQSALTRPAEHPDMLDMNEVSYDTSMTPVFQWTSTSDTNVTNISGSLELMPSEDTIDRFYSSGNTTASWSPSVTLQEGMTYEFDMEFANVSAYQNSDGFYVESKLSRTQEIMFQTGPESFSDLVTTSVTMDDGSYVAGDTVNWHVYCTNAGTGIAASYNTYGESVPFWHVAFLSTDTVFDDGDVIVWTNEDYPRAPGWVHDDDEDAFVIPDGLADGEYYLGFCMDYQDLIAESDETNNVAFSANTISVSPLGDVEWVNVERTKEYGDYQPATGSEEVNYGYQIMLGTTGVVGGLEITTPWGETIFFNDYLPDDWDSANPNFDCELYYEYNGEYVEMEMELHDDWGYDGLIYSVNWWWGNPGAMWASLDSMAATVSFTDSTGTYNQQLEFANTAITDEIPDITGAASSGNTGVSVPSADISWTAPDDSSLQVWISSSVQTNYDYDPPLTILGPSSEIFYDGSEIFTEVPSGISSGAITGMDTNQAVQVELEFRDYYSQYAGQFSVNEISVACSCESFTTQTADGSAGIDLAMTGQPVTDDVSYQQGDVLRLVGDDIWGFADLGDVPAVGFEIKFILSTDTVWGNDDDIVVYSGIYDELAAGETDIEDTGWYYPITLPTDIPDGYYYVGAMIDSGDRYAEISETNNVAFSASKIYILSDVAGTVSDVSGQRTLREIEELPGQPRYYYQVRVTASDVIADLTLLTPWGEEIVFDNYLPENFDIADPYFITEVDGSDYWMKIAIFDYDNGSLTYNISFDWDTLNANWESLSENSAVVSFTDSNGHWDVQLDFSHTQIPTESPDFIGDVQSGSTDVPIDAANIEWLSPSDPNISSNLHIAAITSESETPLVIVDGSNNPISNWDPGVTAGRITGLDTNEIVAIQLEYLDSYYVSASSYPFDIMEFSTINHSEAFITELAPGSTGPDLEMIGRPVLNQTTFNQGDTLTLIGDGTWGYINNGDVPVLYLPFEIHLSADSIWGNSDDVILDSDITDYLAVGEGHLFDGEHSVTLPGDMESGYYYVGMKIDSSDKYAETDETNNVGFTMNRITVGTPTADPLTGLDLQFRLESMSVMQSVNVVNKFRFTFNIVGTDTEQITSARFMTSSGDWYDFALDLPDGWEYVQSFASESELDAAFQQGYYYTVEITLLNGQTGTTTVYFGDADNQTSLARPSDFPDLTIGQVAYDVSTSPTFQWNSISEENVTGISTWLESEPEEETSPNLDSSWFEGDTATTWTPSVTLSYGSTYLLGVQFNNDSSYQNEDGFTVFSLIVNMQQVMFQTAAQSDPDLVTHSVTVQNGNYYAGDAVNWALHVANTGTGIAAAYDNYGESVQYTSVAFLSTDLTFSDDDIIVWGVNVTPTSPGWDVENMESFVIPTGIADGYYYLGFFMDDMNAVVESDETNNIAFSANTITVGNPSTQVVYKVNSLSDTVADDGVLTLREAIQAANTSTAVNEAPAGSDSDVDIIIFDYEALQAQAGAGNALVITLNGTELAITGDLNIHGLGTETLTIDANGLSRVFDIAFGAQVKLFGLTVSGGYAPENGGNIYNEGSLYIENSLITGGVAGYRGGGISNFGDLLVINSRFSGNSTPHDGGAICNAYGELSLADVVIDSNSASFGGAIFNFQGGTVNITNSTLCYNTSSCYGGGIYNFLSTVILRNTIVWGNAAESGREIYHCGFSTAMPAYLYAYNSLFIGGLTGDMVCTSKYAYVYDAGGNVAGNPLFVNPAGGDYSLQSGSPAINAGNNPYAIDFNGDALVVDAAQAPRFNGRVDIGAYEYYADEPVVQPNVNLDIEGGTTFGVLLDNDADGIPDTVMNVNTGEQYAVVNLTDVTSVAFGSTPADAEVEVTVAKTNGWIYTSFADPFSGTREILSVTTADGRIINPSNWWIDSNGNVCIIDDPETVYEFDYGDVPAVVGRHVFYNNSSFDAAGDNGAIAADKHALLAGGVASFANYTSYSRGINGIMVDIAIPSGTITADDFVFRVGNSSDTSKWTLADAPVSIEVYAAQGEYGSDRVVIIWNDSTIVNTWLEVTVLANSDTGLSANDVFYFGNAMGETGNSGQNAYVNVSDVSLVSANQTGFSRAAITNNYDFNRDGKVNITDMGLARGHQSGFTPLRLIDLTVSEMVTVSSSVVGTIIVNPVVNQPVILQKTLDSIWPADDIDDDDSLLTILQSA